MGVPFYLCSTPTARLPADLLPPLQSGFRSGHSTEIAVLRILTDILLSVDRGDFATLVLLDLSAAFDTVDYDILLQRLETSFGVTGTALSWFQTYLSGRTQCVSGATRSSAIPLVCGIPRARSCSQSYSYCMSLTLLQLFRSLACLRTSMPTTLRFTARARLTFTLFTLRAS